MSKKITEQDIIDSVASACQFISFYHPEDFVKGMVEAYENEKRVSPWGYSYRR